MHLTHALSLVTPALRLLIEQPAFLDTYLQILGQLGNTPCALLSVPLCGFPHVNHGVQCLSVGRFRMSSMCVCVQNGGRPAKSLVVAGSHTRQCIMRCICTKAMPAEAMGARMAACCIASFAYKIACNVGAVLCKHPLPSPLWLCGVTCQKLRATSGHTNNSDVACGSLGMSSFRGDIIHRTQQESALCVYRG